MPSNYESMTGSYKLLEKNNIHYFSITQFEKFPTIIHAFSTKRTGVSNLPFEALNLGYCNQDSRENVIANRNLFFTALSVENFKLISPVQQHSDSFCEIEENTPLDNITADGLFTLQKEFILSIQTADCFPIIIYEPSAEIIGIVHAGWKGVLNEIIIKTITAITDKYNVKPKNLMIGIGPGIQQCCYEIKEDVLELFEKQLPYAKKCIRYEYNKIKLDLLHLLLFQLWSLRVSHNTINYIKLCTHCNSRYFFSFRREGPTGRLMSIICKR
ncbi:MAG: hypothetical protein A2Y62_14225 [Candidatus Fischerbacteria bacterium RBG_13_37_8]|uniref:Purine nucleoside phosphorylase n=1 Tax=Candidatus Fischerbacteria bacterium RBG_13_37_8 TaxID=1817863 RepID=A0A1F5VVF8_9BACT|nr:MAG: hypothetical protein A2Y62_14225 [Candidatus Fischerbacteria bacterium RBG_13_37_8]